jgi:uncharacterized membrane protein YphA (DoxX/SURF4 family)
MNETTYHGLIFLALRIIVAVLFFFQSYDKLFRIGTKSITDQMRATFPSVPSAILYFSILLSGIAELTGSLLLLTGISIQWGVVILLIDMAAVALSFSMIRPMWDMQYYFPRLILILILALLPADWDVFRIRL